MTPDRPLTDRQRRVLRLAAHGLTTLAIARRLDTDPSDVRAELAAAIEQLGARSKLEAVLIAARRGEL
jgi:DNA-binding CsgD family transcriptional regulator